MKNVDIKLEGPGKKKMIITVDLSESFGDSKSGKTIIIASSEGNIRVNPDEPDIMLGLNVYRRKP